MSAEFQPQDKADQPGDLRGPRAEQLYLWLGEASRSRPPDAPGGGLDELLGDVARTRRGLYADPSYRRAALNLIEDAQEARDRSSRDTDERRRAEQSLQESEQRLRTIADAVPQLIWMADRTGTATWFNRRWHDYTGLASGPSAAGWDAIAHPDDGGEAGERWRRARAAGEAFEAELRLRGADGSYRWFIGRNVPLRGADGAVTGWVGSATDINDLKEAQNAAHAVRQRLLAALEDTEQARAVAQAATKAKDYFLAVLSHELRTPLNPALLLASDSATNPDFSTAAREAFASIEKNVQVEARLIDDLLDLTRIERGKLKIVHQPVDLHALIAESIDAIRSEAGEKRIRWEIDLAAECETVEGDFGRLQQVLWNVLRNAVKFTPPEGRIRVATRNAEPALIAVEVADSGIGLEAHELPRIFGAFVQGDHSVQETHRFGGLGLGLTITRRLVELHGGTIEAASPGRNQGATFTIFLPLAGRS